MPEVRRQVVVNTTPIIALALFAACFLWAGMSVQAIYGNAPDKCDSCHVGSGEEPACENDAAFVADVTLPQGSCAERRQALEKTWLLRNGGTCAWDTGYTLGWVGASRMGAPEEVPVIGVLPGAVVTVSVPITSFVYAQPTIVESLWQMHSPTGEPFGERLKVRYFVREDCQQAKP